MAWQQGVTALLLYWFIPDQGQRYTLPTASALAVKRIDETNPNIRHLAAVRCLSYAEKVMRYVAPGLYPAIVGSTPTCLLYTSDAADD